MTDKSTTKTLATGDIHKAPLDNTPLMNAAADLLAAATAAFAVIANLNPRPEYTYGLLDAAIMKAGGNITVYVCDECAQAKGHHESDALDVWVGGACHYCRRVLSMWPRLQLRGYRLSAEQLEKLEKAE